MHKRLEDSDTVFRAVSLPSQGRKRKPVRCAIGQVKTAVGIEILVLRVCQPAARSRACRDIRFA
jgi:hypothetical protein